MKAFIAFFILIAGSSAMKLRPAIKALKVCDGYENAPMEILDGSSPDEVPIPGEIEMNLHTFLHEDLPNDLVIKLDLVKQEPFPLDVPCLNGLGSCEYDICKVIDLNADTFCPSFPEGQPCSCPLLQGDFNLKGLKMQVPDFGLLNNLMKGSYEAKGTFYGRSTPDKKVGCIEFTFKFVPTK